MLINYNHITTQFILHPAKTYNIYKLNDSFFPSLVATDVYLSRLELQK